jgi:hypothetical protein
LHCVFGAGRATGPSTEHPSVAHEAAADV